MKNEKNELNSAVSALMNNNVIEENRSERIGRPKNSKLQVLQSNLKKCFKEDEELKAEVSKRINITDSMSDQDKETLRENQKKRFDISESIVNLEENISVCEDEDYKAILIQGKTNLTKELDRVPLEGQFYVYAADEVKRKVGHPGIALSVYYKRSEHRVHKAQTELNNYEKKNGLKLTHRMDMQNILAQSSNKPKVGRVKNSVADNWDKSIKEINNNIFRINQNIAQESHGRKGRGRRRHSRKELLVQKNRLVVLTEKVLNYEAQLSKYELSLRRLKQSKSIRQGFRIKLHSVGSTERAFIKRQIFELNQKIIEEETRLEFIKTSESTQTEKEDKEGKEEIKAVDLSHYVDKDKLLEALENERKNLENRHQYLVEFVQQFISTTPLKKSA